MTSTQSVHAQAEAYIYETLKKFERESKSRDNGILQFTDDPVAVAAKWVADTLHDSKLLRQPNDTEKIAIAVAEAMVAAGFKSGDK